MTYKELKIVKNCASIIETADAFKEIFNSDVECSVYLKTKDGKELDISPFFGSITDLHDLLDDALAMRQEAVEMLSHFKYDLSDENSDSPYEDDREIE